ncbi:MAG: putative toxin-antitoxin system toxin component, PIN family [Treponema sp.]|uniref:putative toxin-antitoxin system toxin component, PIN family n=1 Tax=Treponema sp. TaxID=166 RepID=UPI0025EE7683|nr:putative toxin-antitoxin system toxin component, PIN family [uncultured Treponema sp.]MEE0352898.1 putative toxin-antitoxin system toxin component, PIN family [Treponema sp.]
MKIFCVVDTNVIVSALLKRTSIPGKVVQHILAGIVIPVFSKEILSEYKEVLSRKKFSFSSKVIEDVIKMIIKNGIELSGIQTEEKPSDPKDMIFYEVTMDSRQTQDTFLVTGNIKDFPIKPFIVTPKKMMEIIEENKKGKRE